MSQLSLLDNMYTYKMIKELKSFLVDVVQICQALVVSQAEYQSLSTNHLIVLISCFRSLHICASNDEPLPPFCHEEKKSFAHLYDVQDPDYHKA